MEVGIEDGENWDLTGIRDGSFSSLLEKEPSLIPVRSPVFTSKKKTLDTKCTMWHSTHIKAASIGCHLLTRKGPGSGPGTYQERSGR